MADPLQRKVLDYLACHNAMTLATSGPEGLWAAAVFYASDGSDLYFLSSPATRHARNLEAAPRASATIHEDYRNWTEIRGIQLEGEVRRLEGVEQATALRAYGRKYPFIADLARAPVELARAMSKVAWYRLVPERLYFIDNSLGLGHRDEVPLPLPRADEKTR
jgi:uncharacterized protein YhbP (UPF0306 family)